MSEPDVANVISVAEAIRIIDSTLVAPRTTRMRLREAQGTRLAREVVSDRDYPPFDKSLMDGFAVRAGEVANVPVELRVAGEIAAGQWYTRMVEAGEAVAIMTGAPMPPGADGVVPVEDVAKGEGSIRVNRSTAAGRFIARRGSDIAKGEVVLEKGVRIGAAQIAVAATVGVGMLDVFARPTAAVLATGDELVQIGETPGPAQIRNCNSVMLYALLRRMGCEVTDLGIAPDNPKDIRDALAEGMRRDLLLVSGGMSMGEYDFVPKILAEMGVELKITKVRIKPGKPFILGVGTKRVIPGAMDEKSYADMTHSLPPAGQEKCYVFGLPGNPVSGYACTVRLASRLIGRLSGGEVEEQWIEGKLATAIGSNGPREFYQPVIVDETGVTLLDWKSSGDVFTLARANGLMVRPENDPPRNKGDNVKVLSLADF
jgi:molybdopterin molybdotransferase